VQNFRIGDSIKAANGYRAWFIIEIVAPFPRRQDAFICDVKNMNGDVIAENIAYESVQLESYNKCYCDHFSKLQKVLG
jgi:hypothetical protein